MIQVPIKDVRSERYFSLEVIHRSEKRVSAPWLDIPGTIGGHTTTQVDNEPRKMDVYSGEITPRSSG
jgi:hypothetical protein